MGSSPAESTEPEQNLNSTLGSCLRRRALPGNGTGARRHGSVPAVCPKTEVSGLSGDTWMMHSRRMHNPNLCLSQEAQALNLNHHDMVILTTVVNDDLVVTGMRCHTRLPVSVSHPWPVMRPHSTVMVPMYPPVPTPIAGTRERRAVHTFMAWHSHILSGCLSSPGVGRNLRLYC